MYSGFGKGLQIISMTEPTFMMDIHSFQMFLDMSKMVSKCQGVKRTMGSNLLRCQGIWGQSVYLGTLSFQEERTVRACLLKKVHLVLVTGKLSHYMHVGN